MDTLLAACAFSLMLVGAISCLDGSAPTLDEVELVVMNHVANGFDFLSWKMDGTGSIYRHFFLLIKMNVFGADFGMPLWASA